MSIVWIQHNCETQHYEGFLHDVGFLDHAKKIRQCQFLPWKKNKFIFAAWPLAPLSHYFQQRFVSFLNFCPPDNIWFSNCVIAMATTNTLYFSTWRKKDFLHYALRFEGIVTNYVDISIAGICLIKPNLRCQREKLLRIDRTCWFGHEPNITQQISVFVARQ